MNADADANYTIVTCSDAGPVVQPSLPAQTFGVTKTSSLAACPALDVLMIPGGMGSRAAVKNASLVGWVGAKAAATPRVFTVCTGAALLAQSGALDGRRATSNKIAFQWVASTGPRVQWECSARWVRDGKFLTTSGVAAGTDGALALIADVDGETTARRAAAWAEYAWQSNRTHDPFCQPCQNASCNVRCDC